MSAALGVGAVLIQVQAHCHVLTQTLCCSPYRYPLLNTVSNLVMLARDPGEFSPGDTQGASHARNQRNKQLQLWMDASPSSLPCIQWNPPRVAGRNRGLSVKEALCASWKHPWFLVMCLAFCCCKPHQRWWRLCPFATTTISQIYVDAAHTVHRQIQPPLSYYSQAYTRGLLEFI